MWEQMQIDDLILCFILISVILQYKEGKIYSPL